MALIINKHIMIEVAGQSALMLYFTLDGKPIQAIDAKINKKVQQTASLIRQHFSNVIIDLIPSYASILVEFNLTKITSQDLQLQLKSLLKLPVEAMNNKGKLVELPAYYGIDVCIDLSRIAEHANITIEQVIHLHQAKTYQVYAIGFAPGFAYLGEVDNKIAMPRLATPRLNVPKGAIAIADTQTAVYPENSPGGWNIIGLCPTNMFTPQISPSVPISVGDSVKFIPVSKQEFVSLGGELPNTARGSS